MDRTQHLVIIVELSPEWIKRVRGINTPEELKEDFQEALRLDDQSIPILYAMRVIRRLENVDWGKALLAIHSLDPCSPKS